MRLWLLNTSGQDLSSKPQTLEPLQNSFNLIYRCEFMHIMYKFYLREKANVIKLMFLRDNIF